MVDRIYRFNHHTGHVGLYTVERDTPKCLFVRRPEGGLHDRFRLAKNELEIVSSFRDYWSRDPQKVVEHIKAQVAREQESRDKWDAKVQDGLKLLGAA